MYHKQQHSPPEVSGLTDSCYVAQRPINQLTWTDIHVSLPPPKKKKEAVVEEANILNYQSANTTYVS